MSDPGTSSLPPDRSARLRPGVGWYWIGGVVLVAGVAIGFAWLISTAIAAATRSDDFERIAVPGERRLEFTEAGSFTFYAETAQPVSYYETLVEPDVEVRTLDGRRIGTNISTSTETYSVNGRHGRSFATVDIPAAGVYEVGVTAGPGTGVRPLRVAVGKSFGMDDAAGIIGGILVMGVTFFVGLIILIVTAVKRSRAKRALGPPPGPPPGMPPPAWGGPPPPGWGGPPPPGPAWPPPPGPPPAAPAWPPSPPPPS